MRPAVCGNSFTLDNRICGEGRHHHSLYKNLLGCYSLDRSVCLHVCLWEVRSETVISPVMSVQSKANTVRAEGKAWWEKKTQTGLFKQSISNLRLVLRQILERDKQQSHFTHISVSIVSFLFSLSHQVFFLLLRFFLLLVVFLPSITFPLSTSGVFQLSALLPCGWRHEGGWRERREIKHGRKEASDERKNQWQGKGGMEKMEQRLLSWWKARKPELKRRRE